MGGRLRSGRGSRGEPQRASRSPRANRRNRQFFGRPLERTARHNVVQLEDDVQHRQINRIEKLPLQSPGQRGKNRKGKPVIPSEGMPHPNFA